MKANFEKRAVKFVIPRLDRGIQRFYMFKVPGYSGQAGV
jgi:hypothetical protein